MVSEVSVINALNAAPDNFSPYNTLAINTVLKILETNSETAVLPTFSQGWLVGYAFWISHSIPSR